MIANFVGDVLFAEDNSLERFVNEKSEKYSEEFVKGLFKTLKCIFDYAHRKRYMKHNIFDDVLPWYAEAIFPRP